MSVKIRLKKLGRRHRPFFRVCAMDTRTRRDGREIEVLGTYDPMVPETDARALLNGERIDYWLSVGAKPTPKVDVLIKKYGTNGSHLDAQKEALDKLGGKRASSITAAVAEAEKTKPDAKAEETPAESTEGAETTEATATAESSDAPASEPTASEESNSEETKAEETPAEEASADDSEAEKTDE